MDTAVCLICNEEKSLEQFKSKGIHYPNGFYYRNYCKSCNGKRQRKWRYKNNFGITQEWYEETLIAQGGSCAICGSNTPRKGGNEFFCVDHNKTTLKIRGLLCNPCNLGLGKLGEENLEKALEYIKRYG